MSAHPYDDHVPAPWAPDWEQLAEWRNSCARVFARLTLTDQPAGDVLGRFRAADDATRAAQLSYFDRERSA